MQVMDDRPETIHLYVVREADIRPPIYDSVQLSCGAHLFKREHPRPKGLRMVLVAK